MAKTANVYARIEPELKKQAEEILDALGINASSAMTLFYKQIVLHKGLPFELKLPSAPLDFSAMTEEEKDEALEIGYQQMLRGETVLAKEAFARIHQGLSQ